MTSRLMTHLVAGYPDMETSLEAARAMILGGSSCLEVQFPFSDPSADGPAIQEACRRALEGGFTLDKGFGMIETLTKESPVPVYIMSYAGIVVTRGVAEFCRRAALAGAAGLIIPDLPFDYDEGLYEAGRAAGLEVVPVVVSTIDPRRLEKVLAGNPPLVYAALRAGTTGSRTEIDGALSRFLQGLKDRHIRVLAGFGIQDRGQVEILAPHVYAVVVGSALVRVIGDSHEKALGEGIDPIPVIRAAAAGLVRKLAGKEIEK